MSQTLRLLSGYESLAVMVEERNDNPLQLVVERGGRRAVTCLHRRRRQHGESLVSPFAAAFQRDEVPPAASSSRNGGSYASL
jgi:hypothetical protein